MTDVQIYTGKVFSKSYKFNDKLKFIPAQQENCKGKKYCWDLSLPYK